jgi:hypothetical protein
MPPDMCCICAGAAMVTSSGMVTHLNYEYRTLDGTSPTSTSVGCQDSYMALPAGGWVLAPDDAAAVAVTAAYPWGTHCLVFANGNSIGGTQYYAGSNCDSGTLLQSGNRYAVNGCSRRILIRRQIRGPLERIGNCSLAVGGIIDLSLEGITAISPGAFDSCGTPE